ncbi:FkbM family methyltransferase [Candidatus Pelagibacter sp.]|jgi:FkbM family methyltransferase|nr:FkbM family methyltransferase [Candidatus Pelagibacter sp.]
MNFLKKTLNLCRSKIWFKGMLNGIYATVELEKLVKDIEVPETIIDIGSNKGQFILLMEKIFPNKIVYSFEPIIEMLKKQKKFYKYKKNITFHNLALGSSICSKEFLITSRMDSSSFLKVVSNTNKSKNYSVIEKRDIKVSTLDEIFLNEKISHPILIKMDVQGYELEVLKGANDLLKKIDYLLLEVSENEMYQNQPTEKIIVEYLKNFNFEIYRSNDWLKIQNTNFNQRDIIFQKKK